MLKWLVILASFAKPLYVDHQKKAEERNTYRTEHYTSPVCYYFSYLVCKNQVRKVRFEPVPSYHFAELRRAIVWKFKVGAQAALAKRLQLLIHQREGEIPWVLVGQLRALRGGGEVQTEVKKQVVRVFARAGRSGN